MAISEEQIWATLPGRVASEEGSRSRDRLWRCVKWFLFFLVFFGVWMGWASTAHA